MELSKGDFFECVGGEGEGIETGEGRNVEPSDVEGPPIYRFGDADCGNAGKLLENLSHCFVFPQGVVDDVDFRGAELAAAGLAATRAASPDTVTTRVAHI